MHRFLQILNLDWLGIFLLQFFNQKQKSMIYYINDQDIDRITRLKINLNNMTVTNIQLQSELQQIKQLLLLNNKTVLTPDEVSLISGRTAPDSGCGPGPRHRQARPPPCHKHSRTYPRCRACRATPPANGRVRRRNTGGCHRPAQGNPRQNRRSSPDTRASGA